MILNLTTTSCLKSINNMSDSEEDCNEYQELHVGIKLTEEEIVKIRTKSFLVHPMLYVDTVFLFSVFFLFSSSFNVLR